LETENFDCRVAVVNNCGCNEGRTAEQYSCEDDNFCVLGVLWQQMMDDTGGTMMDSQVSI
jgi:hypothetical protein